MTPLKNKVTEALNETRMLILGAQVLLGFQLSAAFQPRFDHLPDHARWLDLVGLALMSAAVAFLIAPSPFHRVFEGGQITARLHAYTTLMAETALVPFALCIGIDVFIVAERLFGLAISVTAGMLISVIAAVYWYGLEAWRREQAGVTPVDDPKRDQDEAPTSLGERINTMLLETRVVLPGAQALLGFQFTAFLSDGFERLPATAKLVHFASLICVALAIVLLMAPAAYHRLAAAGEHRPDVDRFGSRALLASLLFLSLGLSSEFYVVGARLGSPAPWAIAMSAGALALFLSLWFGYPLMKPAAGFPAPARKAGRR